MLNRKTAPDSGAHRAPCGLHCIRVKNIGVAAGGKALLQNVSLHCHCGELTVLIGRNGAGKSTLLKAILGEIAHTGTVEFRDHENGAIRNMRIGYVPQSIGIDRNSPASVFDLFASLISDRPVFLGGGKRLREQICRQLAVFQAESLLDRRVGSLSGGELQRVMLSVATYPTPDLLVLDEPVSGIDENGLQLFYSTVEQLKKQYDMAIILVSHDLNYVARCADQVILLDTTVRAHGKPAEVFSSSEFRSIFGNFVFEVPAVQENCR
ncbi:MAG: metal ABC transporter ATP-binding protein [Firmicutes bacterium]|nr:metal ABC transporter ATP-binding protein [Bacillota bacterium]